ncbi:MAG TPA: carboxylesterase family protein [Caulobacterales bacterium]|nr:carboxylesterase family protein [Caulobacterales bacterium]
MRTFVWAAAALALAACVNSQMAAPPTARSGADRVRVAQGELEGLGRQASGVREFFGIPYAAPPVGQNRWREPQPVPAWEGVREAKAFGPRCVATFDFADMVYRSEGQSEDCLTLNVWTPAHVANEHLPVLVYFYGGGYVTGAGNEPRYDGEALARRGVIVVTMNYRLGVFGFMAHPELTAQSTHHASGNYAYLDHRAALAWVHANIAAFGGDPARVTIAGESAGSASSSAVMISPLTKNYIAGAIGESGSIVGGDLMTLEQAENAGAEFAARATAELDLAVSPLAYLRELPAHQVMQLAAEQHYAPSPIQDGYFFPSQPRAILAAGEQARVPLLVGSNSAESGPESVLQQAAPTVANYRAALTRDYGPNANAVFAAYPAASDGDAVSAAAQDLANDRFIGQSTWNWIDAATRTGGRNTYYYYFDQPRPALREGQVSPYGPDWRPPRGAMHSAEIEYALGNLDGNPLYAWTATDRAVSEQMQRYFVNFVKTGDPNGEGLPTWGAFASGQRLVIDANTRSAPDMSRARYEAMARLRR